MLHAAIRTKLRAGVVALALVFASVLASAYQAAPAGAAALTNVSWSVSNNQVSTTNVTYAFSFTAATTGTIKTITMAVSGAGLAGAPAISRNFGVGAGSVARAGQTITYTVTAAVSVSAGIPIYLEFSGLTNSGTAGSYTTVITTQTAAPATIDTATSPAVTLAANNTAVTVTVAKSLTFTINNTAFELDLDPSLPALADQTSNVGLTVQTNAHSGYTLTVADNATGLQSAATGNPTSPKFPPAKPPRLRGRAHRTTDTRSQAPARRSTARSLERSTPDTSAQANRSRAALTRLAAPPTRSRSRTAWPSTTRCPRSCIQTRSLTP